MGKASSNPKISKILTHMEDWLGAEARLIRNKYGDKIILSKDGLRRVRFDINRPKPHNNQHMHVEHLVGSKWKAVDPNKKQLYPYDVPHN
ncbi:MAG: hypothetical protein FWG65_11815 [Turicibacter sp.]|nr:hypothetical protein [Turicibacter sp.]